MEPTFEQLVPLAINNDSLVPAIVQDDHTNAVLMLGFMNRAAYEQTRTTKRVTFFSRRRNALWVKGETSGNFLDVVSLHTDCDHDALLIRARPHGPTCHTGSTSCFGDTSGSTLDNLRATIAQRVRELPKNSYTTSLIHAGIEHIGDKVMEEAEEVARAAREETDERVAAEAADVCFHLLVLLEARKVAWNDVLRVLERRSESRHTQ